MQNAAENYSTNQNNNNGSAASLIDWNFLIARAKGVLTDPKGIWSEIKSESRGVGEIYKSYVIPLVLIGLLCGFIGMQIFGLGIAGISIRPPFLSSLWTQAIMFGVMLANLYIAAFVLSKMAPNFGGSGDFLLSFKLAAYSWTAAFIASIFGILPWLGFFAALVGMIYVVYTFFQGITPMLAVPTEKRIPFCLVSLLINFVAIFAFNFLVMTIIPGTYSPDMTIQTPEGEVDLKKFEDNMKQLQKMLPNMGQQ